jgi:RNA polymerase sigma factor, sigma-70 family
MDGTPTHPLPLQLESTDSDEHLMIAFSRGSADAFNELFSRYKQPLFGFFRRRLVDPTYAEELTQETFLVVLRNSVRYQPRALFRTYLYAIGLKILRAHRRKAAFRATFLDAAPAHQEPAAPNNTQEETIVRHALQQLDSIDREILLLREFEQLRYSEIASLLSLPVNTVRSRLFRARVSLRTLLTTPIQKAPTLEPAKPEENI